MSNEILEAAADVEAADIAIAERLGRHRRHPVVRAAAALSEIGDQPELFAVCSATLAYGVIARDPRVARCGARMLASFFVATAIKSGIKRLVSRTRPHKLLDEGHYELKALGPNEGPWNSFPSGHTAGSVAVARAVARTYPAARWPAYAGATAIAAVQVPRGAHYPIDILAGALVGLAAEAIVDRAFDALENDGSPPERARRA